ncbi:oxidoreductase [Mycobacterium kubicae]|uniref:Nitroreductase family protein n=1 Tax=Mycobacterium kubicae TaxID=120959 RepID=A0AAP9V6S9_9MYCO|nr:nitroreductase family protein [Mycobacterium kubicae]MCV7094209.1 nitroreductase family protein [Mycobacterium kubicae]ORW04755.1 nitroreductase [Mycobacterium kubicae]QNI13391.1 nitroreductase family protein [Mycobacterium kubicae]QNI13877.1 nitroreductase family protein [Mycobacterium kubicae]QNI15202.1 nitroreductase family protein [Mycobacterium kubicae]
MTFTLNLSPDELLTTTRAVRRRLDLDRPVDLDVVKECVSIALQAPSGSNRQGWHWLVITDIEQRARIATLYRAAFDEYRQSAVHADGLFTTDDNLSPTQQRVANSVEYLAENLHRVPVLLIPCITAPGSAVLPDATQASMWGSLFPAVWSYMLAARARGLGTVWTDLHLRYEHEVAEVLDIPDAVRQGALIPTAYTLGTDFRPGPRTAIDNVLHIDRW